MDVIRFIDLAAGDGRRVETLCRSRDLSPGNEEIFGVDIDPQSPFVRKGDCIDYLSQLLQAGIRAEIINLDFLILDNSSGVAYLDYYAELFPLIKAILTTRGRFFTTQPLIAIPCVHSLLTVEAGLHSTGIRFGKGFDQLGIGAVPEASTYCATHLSTPNYCSSFSIRGQKFPQNTPVRLAVSPTPNALNGVSQLIKDVIISEMLGRSKAA